MHWFRKFILSWNSTCFGQFLCPSSGVYSLYTQRLCMSYRFVDSFRAGAGWTALSSWSFSKAVYKPVWHIPLLSVQWINPWRWTGELFETCRVSCQNRFAKSVHLVGFIINKFVTTHGHINVKNFFFIPLHIQRAVRQKVIPVVTTRFPVNVISKIFYSYTSVLYPEA